MRITPGSYKKVANVAIFYLYVETILKEKKSFTWEFVENPGNIRESRGILSAWKSGKPENTT